MYYRLIDYLITASILSILVNMRHNTQRMNISSMWGRIKASLNFLSFCSGYILFIWIKKSFYRFCICILFRLMLNKFQYCFGVNGCFRVSCILCYIFMHFMQFSSWACVYHAFVDILYIFMHISAWGDFLYMIMHLLYIIMQFSHVTLGVYIIYSMIMLFIYNWKFHVF